MKKVFVGFDVGGTNVKAGLVSEQGDILNFVSQATQAKKGKKQIAKNVLKIIEELLGDNIKCLGISLAWPGEAHMPLSGQGIKKIISKKYKCPIFLENDANLFTLSEALIGQGKEYKTVVGITMGTGIGCGVVDNNKIFNGKGEASEFGHVSINFDGPRCACGNRGCFEEYVSARAIKRLAKKYKLKVGDGECLFSLAEQGDKKALKVWQEFGIILGFSLIGVVRAYDPDIIVLGGQISKAYKFFGKSMKGSLKYKASFKVPIVKVSKLKNAAVVAAAFVSK